MNRVFGFLLLSISQLPYCSNFLLAFRATFTCHVNGWIWTKKNKITWVGTRLMSWNSRWIYRIYISNYFEYIQINSKSCYLLSHKLLKSPIQNLINLILLGQYPFFFLKKIYHQLYWIRPPFVISIMPTREVHVFWLYHLCWRWMINVAFWSRHDP